MDEMLRIKVKRVHAGDNETKPLGYGSFMADRIPEDGFIIVAASSTSNVIPFYVRDRDLDRACDVRRIRHKGVPVDAYSWEGEVDDGRK